MASSSPASRLRANTMLPAPPIRERIAELIDEVLRSLPDADDLTPDEQRGIIARYAAVLEGNFIYWMTATLLSVKSDEARSIIVENLREEVRDCHPGMMRRFAVAAHAAPTELDALAVYPDLTRVRLFLGRLSPLENLVTMAFFEGFIQRFMDYLAGLARRQGSSELEYTDVHGVCDVTHTEELFRAIDAEMMLNAPESGTDLFQGVELLRILLLTMIRGLSWANANTGLSAAN